MRNNRYWGLISFAVFSLLFVMIQSIILNSKKVQPANSIDLHASQEMTDSRDDLFYTKQSGAKARFIVNDTSTVISRKPLIPVYAGEAWVFVNGGIPRFTTEERQTVKGIIILSELDQLGRCGSAFGFLGPETLPSEERTGIGMIKPSGWHTVKYDFIDGKYLYNRCHLIAYELSGINADERNLITGTRSMNIDVMLAFENQIRWYIIETGNHVLYRVTPYFEGNNLLASGVQIEALSVEDDGQGVLLNVYCYNVQEGISIDYLSGESEATVDIGSAENVPVETTTSEVMNYVPSEGVTYIINSNTLRFHMCDCQSVYEMKDKNRVEFYGTRNELIDEGYIPCGRCNP